MNNNTGFKIKKTAYGDRFETYDGPDVETLEIPEGVTFIDEFALRYSNLNGCKKILFPASLKYVGHHALTYARTDCRQLTELEFLGDVSHIEEEAFSCGDSHWENHPKIQKITFHGRVGEIEALAFCGTGITTLEFPKGIARIGKYAFRGCKQLKELHAPGLKNIGEEAFYKCHNLEVVDIPENTTIGDGAFFACGKLKKDGITAINGVLFDMDRDRKIPNGVVTIGRNALVSKDVEIPATVRVIQEQNNGTFVLPEGFLLTDEKLSGKGLMEYLNWRQEFSLSEVAALYLFQTGKKFEKIVSFHLEKDNALPVGEMVQLLSTKGKAKHYLRAVEFCIEHAREIPAETIQSLYDIGMQKKYKKETELLKPYLSTCDSATKAGSSDICTPWREIYNDHLMDKTLKALALKNLDKIPLADGS